MDEKKEDGSIQPRVFLQNKNRYEAFVIVGEYIFKVGSKEMAYALTAGLFLVAIRDDVRTGHSISISQEEYEIINQEIMTSDLHEHVWDGPDGLYLLEEMRLVRLSANFVFRGDSNLPRHSMPLPTTQDMEPIKAGDPPSKEHKQVSGNEHSGIRPRGTDFNNNDDEEKE
ncbi:MAG: hypothetical protein ABIH87_02655 [bacterium]